ncbi:MAG: hypothetical protein ACREID_05925 [Planctomycetota bacterium]
MTRHLIPALLLLLTVSGCRALACVGTLVLEVAIDSARDDDHDRHRGPDRERRDGARGRCGD